MTTNLLNTLILENILFESVATPQRELYSEKELADQNTVSVTSRSHAGKSDLERENERLRKELNQLKVKEVERQQTQFDVGIND